jgi:hypothetical protein
MAFRPRSGPGSRSSMSSAATTHADRDSQLDDLWADRALHVQLTAYPAGTPIYSPAGGNEYWLAQSHYLVKLWPKLTLYEMAQQANPTGAVRFMVPYGSTDVIADGFDFEKSPRPPSTAGAPMTRKRTR